MCHSTPSREKQESKNPAGIATVRQGVLRITRREDPDDWYEQPGLAPKLRARSAALAESLRGASGEKPWVQPVVVLWAPFEQESIESDGVAWIRGGALARVLEARPVRLAATQVEAFATAVDHVVATAASS